MKHNYLFTLALAVVMAFVGVGCEKSPEETPEAPVLTLAKATDSVAAGATSYSLSVESNCDWTATASQGVAVDPASGNGDATVALSFAANTAYEPVTYTVTFAAKGVESQTFTLTQVAADKPVPVLTVAASAEVAAEATSYELAVESNYPWTATASEGLTISPAAGDGNGTVALTFAANETYEAATYTVTFAVEGLDPKTFTLTQAGKPAPVLTVAASAEVAAEATSYELAVESNYPWTATASEGLTISPAAGDGNGTVALTFAANETYEAATYTVTFAVEGLDPKTFTLTQAALQPVVASGTYWLFATKDGKTSAMTSLGTKNYGYAESEAVVNGVSYAENVFTLALVEGVKDGYTICDVNGKYYYQEAGTTYKTFNVGTDATLAGCVWIISKNEDQTYNIVNRASGKHIRYGEGTYTSFGAYAESEFNGSVAIQLVAAENAKPRPVLNVSADTSVGNDATTYSIEVESNLAWTATASEGVTLDKAAGEGNGTVVMTFAANETAEAIARTVTFTAEGLTKVFTLTHKAPAAEGAAVLLDEDFSSLKTWSSTNVTTLKANNLTWTTAGGSMYEQQGCIKFGKSSAAANTGVKLPTLSSLTAATDVVLTFKAVSSDSGYTMVVSATGGATVGTLSPKAITKYSGGAINSGADTATKMADAFAQSTAEFSVTIQGVTAETVISIVASGSAKRWYLDDVKIEAVK